MAGFDELYRQGEAVTWQAGKEDVVRQVAERLMGLDAGSRVLDFGCGTGWPAPILTARGARYLGIDPSGEGIAVAQRRYGGLPHVRFHRMAMDETLAEAFQGARFTHVFALDALYFVPDVEGVLRALRDALEDGGMLASISHLYRESRAAEALLDDLTREFGCPHFLSGVQWSMLLERNGWTDVQRCRMYDRRPFDPSAFLGQPPEEVRLAREMYEREGALVVTARKPAG